MAIEGQKRYIWLITVAYAGTRTVYQKCIYNVTIIYSISDYECFGEGSLNGYEYDQTTGKCACAKGWYSETCEKSKLKRCLKSKFRQLCLGVSNSLIGGEGGG